jgi:hypothetical protein
MEWETFYNCHRQHASLKGKTPYEILLEKLQSNPTSTEVVSSTPSLNALIEDRRLLTNIKYLKNVLNL